MAEAGDETTAQRESTERKRTSSFERFISVLPGKSIVRQPTIVVGTNIS
jgi:hypothetical protein